MFIPALNTGKWESTISPSVAETLATLALNNFALKSGCLSFDFYMKQRLPIILIVTIFLFQVNNKQRNIMALDM